MISRRRLNIVASFFVVALLVIVARGAQIQLSRSEDQSREVQRQQTLTYLTQAPRGTIYDRHGNVMAVSRFAYHVRVDLTITDTEAVADVLGRTMARPVAEARAKLQAIISDSHGTTPTVPNLLYANVAPQAVFALTSTLAQAKRGGLLIEETWARAYPQGPVAGPSLGIVNLQPRGYSGVEGAYNDRLNSTLGVRKERAWELLVMTPTQSGSDLVLTLDLGLQGYVERRLAQAISEYEAAGGTIIVMESRTGAVLASASQPGYDPNVALDLINREGIDRIIDPAASIPYEPGSVVKVATIAAALDSGMVTTTELFTDTGRFEVSGKIIRNSDLSGHGLVDVEDTLARSLNVVAAQIAFRMGPEKLYRYLQLFGFGRNTGIDLENEVRGVLRTPNNNEWSKVDLATNSYGQGMSVTPFQLINAVNVIANDGVLLQPYIAQQWREPNGKLVVMQPVPVQRVISPETARLMRSLMAIATRRGTPDALPKGYTVAGKTGTADWYLRGMKQDTTFVTFVAFLPAPDPRLTILVKLDQPKTSRWASETTVPVFKDVAAVACRMLGIAPDIVAGAAQ